MGWSNSKRRSIETFDTQTCPFCGGRDIFSGSWSPEMCRDCRSVYFFGLWHEPEPEDDTAEAMKLRARKAGS